MENDIFSQFKLRALFLLPNQLVTTAKIDISITKVFIGKFVLPKSTSKMKAEKMHFKQGLKNVFTPKGKAEK